MWSGGGGGGGGAELQVADTEEQADHVGEALASGGARARRSAGVRRPDAPWQLERAPPAAAAGHRHTAHAETSR